MIISTIAGWQTGWRYTVYGGIFQCDGISCNTKKAKKVNCSLAVSIWGLLPAAITGILISWHNALPRSLLMPNCITLHKILCEYCFKNTSVNLNLQPSHSACLIYFENLYSPRTVDNRINKKKRNTSYVRLTVSQNFTNSSVRTGRLHPPVAFSRRCHYQFRPSLSVFYSVIHCHVVLCLPVIFQTLSHRLFWGLLRYRQSIHLFVVFFLIFHHLSAADKLFLWNGDVCNRISKKQQCSFSLICP